MSTHKPRYLSFMLRMWQITGEECDPWRVSLEAPGSNTRKGFKDLRSAFQYLEEITAINENLLPDEFTPPEDRPSMGS